MHNISGNDLVINRILPCNNPVYRVLVVSGSVAIIIGMDTPDTVILPISNLTWLSTPPIPGHWRIRKLRDAGPFDKWIISDQPPTDNFQDICKIRYMNKHGLVSCWTDYTSSGLVKLGFNTYGEAQRVLEQSR